MLRTVWLHYYAIISRLLLPMLLLLRILHSFNGRVPGTTHFRRSAVPGTYITYDRIEERILRFHGYYAAIIIPGIALICAAM